MEDEDKILDDIDKANASSDLVDAFKEPFESDNLSKSMFEALPGVFDDPTFGDFNRTVVGGAVDVLDLGLRTIESGVKGSATLVNEAKNYITGQDDDRLKRDLINFFVTTGVGSATSGSMKMRKGISELAKQGKKEDVAKVILAESDAFKNDNLKTVMAMTAKREPSPVMVQKTPKLTTETIRIGQFPANQKRGFLEGDTVTLYHGTSRSSLSDITKGGLKGDAEGLVYASPDVHSATGYGSVMGGEKANKARSGKQVKFNTDDERITLKYEIPKEKFLELIGNPNVTQRSISSRVKLFNEDSPNLFRTTKDNPQFYSRGKPISSAGNYYEGTEIRFKEGDLDKYLVGTVQRVRTPKENVSFNDLRKDATIRIDSPAGKDVLTGETYVEKKIRQNKEYMKRNPSAGPVGLYEGITGRADNVKFNPKELQGIKGEMGEDAFRMTGDAGTGMFNKLKEIEQKIKKEGYKPTNIKITVTEDGTPYVTEGNHRLAEALKSDRPFITADINYLRGGEAVDGPLNPTKIGIGSGEKQKSGLMARN